MQKKIDKRKKILIVDDEPLSLNMAFQIINGIGNFNIISSHSANDALKKMSDRNFLWKPDLIITDFMMDNGDGIDLLKNMRKKMGNSIPFVFVTSINPVLIVTLTKGLLDIMILSKPIRSEAIKEIFSMLDLDKNENENEKINEDPRIRT